MEEVGKKPPTSLTDIQKGIIIEFLILDPGLLEGSARLSPGILTALNESCQEVRESSVWLEAFINWKDGVLKDYFYAQKSRNFVSSIEDIQLLVLLRNEVLSPKCQTKPEEDNGVGLSCRICLTNVNQEETFNLFTSFIDNLSLAQLLNTFTDIIPIKEDDDLPDVICLHCSKLLRTVHNFKVLCENNDQRLREAIKKSEELPEMEENDFFDEETVSVLNHEYPYEGNFNEIQNSVPNAKCEDLPQSSSAENGPEMCKSEPPEAVLELIEKMFQDPALKNKTLKIGKQRKHCDTCGKNFATPNSLWVHNKRVHLKDKPHVCDLCGKHFRTRLEIKNHIRTHTNERPFICETCGKCFKTLSAVNAHRVSHQSEKQVQCPVCPYRTTTKANLKIHERTHSGAKPYTCQFCDATFMTSSNKQKHIQNIHKKMRVHKCAHCEKTFFAKQSAFKHSVIHTGAKPYKCPVCMISYAWYNGFQKHMRMQHRGVEVPKESAFHENFEMSK
ncbi:zinc finger protein-like [Lutzomyia longipalpis]|uniref:zinc finger protein-like n=1 Tax=Lutzomyia longipalpis TaxID=7200 RepID=UPI00248338B2|nr:zinc finger protein-like [Lutzomyia longipalpis]